ncbi:MAG: RluA family pseudouridine synthase [Alphaproteobacteria bacterium]|nr:RluA family pseudouridine synthase [Alphaproteobacteria bacterium]
MAAEIRNFIVTEDDTGMRLDKFLAVQMPDFSRTEIQKFEIKKPTVDSRQLTVKLSEKIKPGDEFSVAIPVKQDKSLLSTDYCLPNTDLEILFEDNDIIVVNKPRGIAMYPGAGNETDTLVHAVLTHTTLADIGGDTRPGVVHRLDKGTSGVVILAKTDAAYRELVKTFAAHDLVRKYVAFVWGVPNWESADISGNIGRSTHNRQKMTMVKVGGKEAHTSVVVLNAWSRNGVSEFRCTLGTGRTHQIRVHLSAHGFPVLCDPTYGRGSTRFGSVKNPELLEFIKTHNMQMLHAELLELSHPITGEKMKFKSKLPDDMLELKEILDL